MDYTDIIDKKRPEHKDDAFAAKHPRMPVSDRAKIFSAFAALRTHEPTAKQRERLTMQKIELSPDDAQCVSDALVLIKERLRISEETCAAVTYFVPDAERVGEGIYTTVKGTVRKINEDMGYIKIEDKNILFADIYRVSI